MTAVPLELKEANKFVEQYNPHHKPVHRDKFRIGCVIDVKPIKAKKNPNIIPLSELVSSQIS